MISKRCRFCGHVARLPASTPVNQLGLQVDSSLNSVPCYADWKRRSGRRRGRWVGQLRHDNHSSAYLWHSSTAGHSTVHADSITTTTITTQ